MSEGMKLIDLDWLKLGNALRASATDAFDGDLPPIAAAYAFLLDNPECFTDSDEWPEGMPTEAPTDLIAGYYGIEGVRAEEPEVCECLPIHISHRYPRPWEEDLAQAWWDARSADQKRQEYPVRLWTTDAWRALDGGERCSVTEDLCNAGLVKDSRDCAVHGPALEPVKEPATC